jgi:glutamate dehydrogenase
MDATIRRLAPAVEALRRRLAPAAATSVEARSWAQAGVPAQIATQVAMADGLFAALDIAEIAEATQRPLDEVAEAHSGVGAAFGLTRLRTQITALPSDTYWQSRARAALGDDLAGLQRAIAFDAVKQPADNAAARLAAWEAANAATVDRTKRLLAEFGDGKNVDLAMLSVALRELRNLA